MADTDTDRLQRLLGAAAAQGRGDHRTADTLLADANRNRNTAQAHLVVAVRLLAALRKEGLIR